MSGFFHEASDLLEKKKVSLQVKSPNNDDHSEDPDVIKMAVKFDKREYPPQITPKMHLLEWCRREKLVQPAYETEKDGSCPPAKVEEERRKIVIFTVRIRGQHRLQAVDAPSRVPQLGSRV
ncbi:hypothetical protein Chor_013309 [Crotalus horridus]